VHHAAATYRGDGKTDAKDARIIADQARMRTDLQPVRSGDQISTDLRLLTARRTDLVYDRVRTISRLRAALLEYFAALEAAFDYSRKAPLILLSGYQTPQAIRQIGATRLAAWLRKRSCRGSANVARKAVDAASAQHAVLRTEAVGSQLVAQLARQITAIDAEIAQLDTQICERFERHPDAPILLSMPGFGPVLAATFLANTGGDLRSFETVGRLASVAGLAPAPRDSGRISGNHHRPRRFNRAADENLLPRCTLEPEEQPGVTSVLRTQTSRSQVPQAGPHRPRQTTHQHAVGHAPRPHDLPGATPGATDSSGLTTALRFPVPGNGPGPRLLLAAG
jgi:transposase